VTHPLLQQENLCSPSGLHLHLNTLYPLSSRALSEI
jgi:hypothetical protein